MSLITKQIDDLRDYAEQYNYCGELPKALINAADTIETLSAKLSAANIERSIQYYHGGWIPCSNPPKHHRDVLVRGTEAIGNVTVHKVMLWDVDVWRPTNYAPSIIWEEWSEI